MGITIHVNGTANSLAHKGSNGIAIATIPDVCKTPSPGGPVPIPYPNIAMANSLAKGTKKVKVDGKKMAAIKGSELSRSNGDEAGTAGGVKSSTNMKEAKWLLYSFDVKLEGKNACRLGDKLQMNHGNTVCLGGWGETPVAAGPTNPLPLDCDKPKYSDCEKKQICAKAKEINKHAKDGKLKRLTGDDMKEARKAGDKAAAQFREVFAIIVHDKMYTDDMMKSYFAHECAFEEWKKKKDPGFRDPFFSPDHILEVQFGGDPLASTNLKWTSKKANEFLGGSLSHYDTDKNDGVAPNCCEG